MLKRFKIDPFVLAIIISILIAYILPQAGASDGAILMHTISSLGISLIFFFYGLSLSTEAINNGLKNWRLHVVVQGSTFLLFPLLVLIFYPFVKDTSQKLLWLAFLFMAALPSTVSSSVVMVAIAKGNLPSAIFNPSISGIISIMLIPCMLIPAMQQVDAAYDFT